MIYGIIFVGSRLIVKAVPFLQCSGIASLKKHVTCIHILQEYLQKYPLNSQQ